MNQKSVLFAATLGTVGVVVMLALMVSLWPEKKPQERGASSNAGAALGAANAADSPARATATANRPSKAESGPVKSTDSANSTQTIQSPIVVEMGTAQVRNPETGQMEDRPFTMQVLQLRNADGTPQTVDGAGVVFAAGEDGSTQPNGKVTYKSDAKLPTGRPRQDVNNPGGIQFAPKKESPQSAPANAKKP
jgi:hypothetical protein